MILQFCSISLSLPVIWVMYSDCFSFISSFEILHFENNYSLFVVRDETCILLETVCPSVVSPQSDILDLYIFSINIINIYMVNLIIWQSNCPSGYFPIYLWMYLWEKVVLLTTRLLDVTKSNYSLAVVIVIFMVIFQSTSGHISSFSILLFASPNTIIIDFSGKLSYILWLLLHKIHLYLLRHYNLFVHVYMYNSLVLFLNLNVQISLDLIFN